MRARPNRSHSQPPIQPPNAAAKKLALAIDVAWVSVSPSEPISNGMRYW